MGITALIFYIAGRAMVPSFLRDVNPLIVGILVYVWYRWARTKEWWPKPVDSVESDAPMRVQVPHGVLIEKLKKKAKISQNQAAAKLPPKTVQASEFDIAAANESVTVPTSKEAAKRVRVKTVRKKVIRARRAKMDWNF